MDPKSGLRSKYQSVIIPFILGLPRAMDRSGKGPHMASRLRITGVALIIVGIVALLAAGYAYMQVQAGQDALKGFSAAQNVALSYNEDGDLIDRGSTEEAAAILALLEDTWNWPVSEGDLNPDDPVTNTATEYMYQMATIAHHTLTGTQTVVLTEPVEWDGDGDGTVAADAPTVAPGEWDPSTAGQDAIFQAGVYQVPVNNRYWTGFNRLHPLDGPAREQAWNGTVHGLFAELGVGATTHSSLQLALGVAAVTALLGLGFIIGGAGLLWTGMAKKREETATVA
jgi:type II secretory pathway pseudopilin PulG